MNSMGRRIVRCLLLTGCALAAHTAVQAQLLTDPTFFADRERGWFWYEREAELVSPAKPPSATVPKSSGATKRPEVLAFEKLQRELTEAQQIALIAPTPENQEALLSLRIKTMRMVAAFSDSAEQIRNRMPHLDLTFDGIRPTNPVAMQAFDRQRLETRDALLRSLSSEYGLFFYLRGDCPFCHAMAPLLKQFQARYGFTVFAVTLDGGAPPEYPDARRDNGMLTRILTDLNVSPEQFQVPFVALARPSSRDIVPIGFGVLNADEIADRIHQAHTYLTVTKARSPASDRDSRSGVIRVVPTGAKDLAIASR